MPQTNASRSADKDNRTSADNAPSTDSESDPNEHGPEIAHTGLFESYVPDSAQGSHPSSSNERDQEHSAQEEDPDSSEQDREHDTSDARSDSDDQDHDEGPDDAASRVDEYEDEADDVDEYDDDGDNAEEYDEDDDVHSADYDSESSGDSES